MLKIALSLVLIVFGPTVTAGQMHVTFAPSDIQVDQENGAADGVGDSVTISAEDLGDDSTLEATAGVARQAPPQRIPRLQHHRIQWLDLAKFQLEQWCGQDTTTLPTTAGRSGMGGQ